MMQLAGLDIPALNTHFIFVEPAQPFLEALRFLEPIGYKLITEVQPDGFFIGKIMTLKETAPHLKDIAVVKKFVTTVDPTKIRRIFKIGADSLVCPLLLRATGTEMEAVLLMGG
jgi:hypothetical protein